MYDDADPTDKRFSDNQKSSRHISIVAIFLIGLSGMLFAQCFRLFLVYKTSWCFGLGLAFNALLSLWVLTSSRLRSLGFGDPFLKQIPLLFVATQLGSALFCVTALLITDVTAALLGYGLAQGMLAALWVVLAFRPHYAWSQDGRRKVCATIQKVVGFALVSFALVGTVHFAYGALANLFH